MKKHFIPLSAFVWVFFFGFGVSPALSSEEAERIGPFGLEKSGPSRTERFDGRQLVVRLYRDWRRAPVKYEEMSLKLKGEAAKLELGRVKESAVVVIAAEGQRDEEVRKELEGFLYAELYKKGLEFRMPDQRRRRDTSWSFNDGLGEALPNVTVGLFIGSTGGPKVMVGSSTGNELRIPGVTGGLKSVSLVIWHPDYGFAQMPFTPSVPDNRPCCIEVPLVRKGSEAWARGIRGLIVGPDGKPVQGATVACGNVRTLGEGLINSYDERCRAMSDEDGKFSMYVPNDNGGMERGYLIPPESTYHVRIEAPREMGLLPQNAAVSNEEEVRIVMERGSHFHTFVFRDDSGVIKDRERLPSSIKIERAGKQPITLGYEDWKDGGMFPVGTYTAEAFQEQFEPIELTERSPRELVFGPTATITYYGQVVEGMSGRPMEGAFVIGMSGGRGGNSSQITDVQWEALEALGAEPSMEDAALTPLKKMYVFDRIVRTDADGRYEMSYKDRSRLYGFVFFARNYLGVMHRKHALTADEDMRAAVPVKKLFPAAKVVVKPVVGEEHVSIMPKWTVNDKDEYLWVKDLLACDDRKETLFTYDKWLPQNRLCSFHVPAGVRVSVRLLSPYDEQWCPATLAEDMRLAQGQVRDFGEVKFERALQVSIKVLNSKGEPLEGVPVRLLQSGERAWSVAHNTDVEGVTWFDVPPATKGQFGVSFWGPGASTRETMDYEVGADDDGQQFEMTISDEMVGLLFGRAGDTE